MNLTTPWPQKKYYFLVVVRLSASPVSRAHRVQRRRSSARDVILGKEVDYPSDQFCRDSYQDKACQEYQECSGGWRICVVVNETIPADLARLRWTQGFKELISTA
jgi:hypothetical protein